METSAHIQGYQDADIACPDATRSMTGAWILPGSLEARVSELKTQDPSRTPAQCFQLLGAVWKENYYDRSNDHQMAFYFKDPIQTRRTRVADGIEYRGGWCMTLDQKAEAGRLKAVNQDWEWSRCYQEAGGRWDSGYFNHITNEDAQYAIQHAQCSDPEDSMLREDFGVLNSGNPE
ncbi:uncharacterized protein EI97DRAFT_470982 [Westerdykella ornata]|uniref:Uncharacterized protein n=1 Tax=Westerdykella ornata TaxID=318751 RepID=A0A6A6J667_WESOR|nr:uncharacterized protein EI97DRAFT_470982 [Westerdykella ornata]KAF2271714.1 hypothetical protein EI97DRAFT_470982 [Westerdykella ornata]